MKEYESICLVDIKAFAFSFLTTRVGCVEVHSEWLWQGFIATSCVRDMAMRHGSALLRLKADNTFSLGWFMSNKRGVAMGFVRDDARWRLEMVGEEQWCGGDLVAKEGTNLLLGHIRFVVDEGEEIPLVSQWGILDMKKKSLWLTKKGST
ncbi:hypothetical protein SLE2022_291820 [Rubroshorea leprosula]